MPNLYIDFDGTLIDSRQRQYQLFCELVPTYVLSFEEYWDIKRQRVNQEEMLRRYYGYTDNFALKAFHEAWMSRIEEPTRLALDRPLPGADAFLRRAHSFYALHLITARQNPQHVEEQIKAFGWGELFSALLVTGQQSSKALCILKHSAPQEGDVMIGDTGEDIKAARELGLPSVAVASGVLNAEVLMSYNPERMVDSVMDLKIPIPFK